ncbi:MAG: acyl-CoA thioesterase [Weeksellaceae bacterium]|nr:acyl-CoA thioesterase [Weeksellaceae bacterium]
MRQNKIVFQFLSEPTDVNYGGKVHGGAVMKWIDQTGFSCATMWSESYCVTVYVGGIRFYKPIHIGDLVRLEAQIIYTGRTSMHIAINVYSRKVSERDFEKKTHCIIVFAAVDEDGNTVEVPKFQPTTDTEIEMENYAIKLMNLRKNIEDEMSPFLISK